MGRAAKITNSGKPLSARRLRLAEDEMGTSLTEEHRKFLLKCNGGKPVPSLFWIGGECNALDQLERFYGIGGEYDLLAAYNNTKHEVGSLAVPLGDTGSGDQLIQFVRGPGKGEVWFLSHEQHGEMEFVSKSIAQLLRSFRTE